MTVFGIDSTPVPAYPSRWGWRHTGMLLVLVLLALYGVARWTGPARYGPGVRIGVVGR